MNLLSREITRKIYLKFVTSRSATGNIEIHTERMGRRKGRRKERREGERG